MPESADGWLAEVKQQARRVRVCVTQTRTPAVHLRVKQARSCRRRRFLAAFRVDVIRLIEFRRDAQNAFLLLCEHP